MCEGHSCMQCQWNFGAIKHHCPERGGDASFEPSGDRPLMREGFIPYVLQDGPIQMLDSNDVKWKGKFYKDGVHQVNIESAEHERQTLKEMGCHLAEPGETVGKHEWRNKGRPKRKNYSFPGIKGANSCQNR